MNIINVICNGRNYYSSQTLYNITNIFEIHFNDLFNYQKYVTNIRHCQINLRDYTYRILIDNTEEESNVLCVECCHKYEWSIKYVNTFNTNFLYKTYFSLYTSIVWLCAFKTEKPPPFLLHLKVRGNFTCLIFIIFQYLHHENLTNINYIGLTVPNVFFCINQFQASNNDLIGFYLITKKSSRIELSKLCHPFQ